MSAAPLKDVRVLSLGGIWAGRVAAMLLADQGAQVIEIDHPRRAPQPEDALLARGKQVLTLDLASADGSAAAFALAAGADIVIDNLGPGRAVRFGLDYDAIKCANPTLVYVSLPGFATGTGLERMAAWEGTLDASVGVYTDLHATGALLGGAPIYTAVPMASAYGGVHGAIAATLAFLHRLRSGAGQLVEVPLADALMAGMALLAMRVEGQPERFDLPAIDKAMTDVAFPILRELEQHLTAAHRAAIGAYLKRFAKPLFTHYTCADGRIVFLNALDHGHQSRAALETLGVLGQLLEEGMVLDSPYQEGGDGNNIANAATLAPRWTARLQALLTERFASRGADDWCLALQQAGVPCARVRSAAEWLADPVARDSGCVARLGDAWQAGRFISIDGEGCASPALAAAQTGPAPAWLPRAVLPPPSSHGTGAGMLAGVRVLDLSNVIAGPVSARTLAEYGADVIRIDAPLPLAGPRMTMWFGIDVNQGKRAAIVDLKSPAGREVLERLVREADVVIHNFLDRSLDAIGIGYEQLRRIRPDIICCQVSAWAGPEGGPYKDFPAFDPVLQAATGITARYGSPQAPVMHGVASCVDYISGFCAALGVAQALVARAMGRGGSLVCTSLAMGAQLVQFPFMTDAAQAAPAQQGSGQQLKGSAPWHGMYRTQDGWVFLALREADIDKLAVRLGVAAPTRDAITGALLPMRLTGLRLLLREFPSASVVKVRMLEHLRGDAALPADSAKPVDIAGRSTPMAVFDHPCGYRTTLPLPGWCRSSLTPLRRLGPAPLPGADTAAVLAEAGVDGVQAARLFADGAALPGWTFQQRYFPL